MDFAVVKIGGKQYKVSVGDVVEVNRLAAEKDKKVKFDEVLLVSSDGKIKVGTPTVKNSNITATLIENKKGEKVHVAKFKSKVRYRRTSGFRPLLSLLKIDKIES